ncbi:flagellar basal body rod protein FlgG [Litchfieldia salsa]|uniref:Flagellar hook protein FlgE n=1 Tax=Litchfieldia salsa TaxID=930152 RepID=A0A1H0R6W5_9BACI|nr:flagellar basal body rod protein FlgG [Litchfieldia salsa]SDP25273.1 flagellar hook protein FlgE [Litchfieldia salsa]
MLRSLYSGISGMKNFQSKLDVIGNNIANVNTFGFKKSRVTFQDLMSQQVAGATQATETRGGINAKQIGLGSSISAIDTIHTGGSTQTTSRMLDLTVAGDGFFAVGSIKDPALVNNDTNAGAGDNKITGNIDDAIELNYTRAGNFYMDQDGYLVTAEGLYLIGQTGEKTPAGATPSTWTENISADAGLIQIPMTAKSFSISPDGKVSFVNEGGELKMAGQIKLANFANVGGLEKLGANLYRSTGNSGTLDRDGVQGIQINELQVAGTNGTGSIVSGALEMSNVDLSEEFTEMIVSQRGFQSNTKIITTSDEILQELVNLKR